MIELIYIKCKNDHIDIVQKVRVSTLKITYTLHILVMFTILMTLIIGNSRISADEVQPSILFDFSSEQLNVFYTPLNGDWIFFEKQLLTPSEMENQIERGNGNVVSLPSSFQTQTGDINTFGTYGTKVKIPKQYIGETLAIHIPYQYSAYKLFVDQTEVAKNGVVGVDETSHIAEMAPATGYFIAQEEEVLLTMQLSSFEHIRGGFENAIYLGEASVVSQKFNTKMTMTLFINGCIFIIGLFMFLFAFYRRQETLFLIFGLFAILISVRALFAVPFYYTLISDISWLWGTRLEYILTIGTSMLYVILLWKWHEQEFSKKVMYGLVIVHVSLIVITLFTQPVLFQKLFFNVFYLTIPTFIYLLYVIYKSIRNKNLNTNAIVNIFGTGIIFLAFFNDFAIGQGWYRFATVMLPAVAVYVLIHVLLMSKGFADSIRQTEQQNKQLVALNASNEKLAIQLQEEIKRKDDFLANTSHELRNPLHGIINIAQSILRNRYEQLDDKLKQDLQLQLTIGNHMSYTLNDLLDISRLKEDQIELQRERLNLKAISEGVVSMFKVLIENKNIQIKIQIRDEFPTVVADQKRLTQILFNLLHNAIKFTNEGTITIDATIEDGKAQIHVSDTGIGMSEEVLATIFDAYKQGDSSITAIGGGVGLGLSICKQLVELHGGTIQASSKLGEGSTFIFTLPLADESFVEQKEISKRPTDKLSKLTIKETPIAMNQAMIKAFIESTTSTNKSKILAVDDDPVNLHVLTNILSEDRYEIESVTSGKEALKKLEFADWDLVISDVMMPNMSGYDLTREIRKKYSISELPVLLLTARSNPEDIYAGFIAGANDYVTKPVDAIELITRVKVLTDLQISFKERLGMEAAWLQAQIRPHFLLNTLNAILSLSEVDRGRMNQLLEEFVNYLQSSFYLKNLDKLVPLEYELDLLHSYLYIEKERFSDRLHVNWEIDETVELEEVMIPPLSLQTIVENAVNHGVLKKKDGGSVTIHIRKEGSYVEISVIDDGVGMDEEKIKQILTIQPHRKSGIGVVNTEQRLKRLFGKGLRVQSILGEGTTVSFTVPTNQS